MSYNVKTDPSLSDQCLIWDSANATWVRVSLNSVLELFDENITLPEVATQYYSPQDTGFSVDVGTNIDNGSDIHLILTPSDDYATGTIVLPINSSLVDKQTILVNCTKAVTTLTIDANGASNVIGEPTALAENDFFTLKYDLTMSTWYRVG